MKYLSIKYCSLLTSILLFLGGCIDPFETSVEQGEKRVVVQGRITSEDGPYSVILTNSGNYSSSIEGISTYISGASVCIYDDQDNCIELYESESGRYYTIDDNFQGKIGNSYYLEIILPEGEIIRSETEKMLQPPPINRAYYEYISGDEIKKEGFYVYIDTQEPGDERNYYKWETISWWLYSWDPCWHRVPDFEPFNILSDENINGNLIAGRLVKIVPYSGTMPYVVTIHQIGLSERAFRYIEGVNAQINLSGSIFDPPPTFLKGNLYKVDDEEEIVLGYFYVGGISTIEIAIDRTIPETSPRPGDNILPKPLYCGDPCDILCATLGGGICGEEPCPPECNEIPNITYKSPDTWPIHIQHCDDE